MLGDGFAVGTTKARTKWILHRLFHVDFYSDNSPAEQLFRYQAENLRLLAPLPQLTQVQDALKKHMPKRVERFLPRLKDPVDVSLWLGLILKANFLIRLWRTPNEPVLVALSVSGGSTAVAQKQMSIIQSAEFSATRRELGIAKHWLLTFKNQMVVPSRSDLLDILHEQLELEAECGIITIGARRAHHASVLFWVKSCNSLSTSLVLRDSRSVFCSLSNRWSMMSLGLLACRVLWFWHKAHKSLASFGTLRFW